MDERARRTRLRPRRGAQVAWCMLNLVLLVFVEQQHDVKAFYPQVTLGEWGVPTWQNGRRTTSIFAREAADEYSGNRKKNSKKRIERSRRGEGFGLSSQNRTAATSKVSRTEEELLQRVTQLEQLVATQSVELKRLKEECKDLTHAAAAFARVVELLRAAGLQTDEDEPASSPNGASTDESATNSSTAVKSVPKERPVVESFDDNVIFGRAPSSVIDAADAAGAAILAAMLGGQQRMLVDVRDAELSRDVDTLVQFIELAILPVAAGLEGLKSKRNRLKIVFPTVKQLLDYRKTMALAAPEVVALSTLGFDPVEEHDNLVVIVAPSPDDEEGLAAMNELLEPSTPGRPTVKQPVVVLNPHMIPLNGPAAKYEVAYHLRLLTVQYVTGEAAAQEYFSQFVEKELPVDSSADDSVASTNSSAKVDLDDMEDDALEAAMKHAHEVGIQQGTTRAMVIRAFPNPWHVFVDTSPDTDADFEVAATFDESPSQDDVNLAIVECIEGSEREDELVAQQMQEALETGQLDHVSEILGSMGMDIFDDEDDDDIDDDDEYWRTMYGEDSV